MRHAAHKLKTLPSMYKPVPIECVETGTRYKSMSEAARVLGLNRRNLSYAVEHGNQYGGYGWKKVIL